MPDRPPMNGSLNDGLSSDLSLLCKFPCPDDLVGSHGCKTQTECSLDAGICLGNLGKQPRGRGNAK